MGDCESIEADGRLISGVIDGVRKSFLESGMDLEMLAKLEQLWISKLKIMDELEVEPNSMKKKGINFRLCYISTAGIAGDAATYEVNEIGEADTIEDEPVVGRNNSHSFIDFVFFEENGYKW